MAKKNEFGIFKKTTTKYCIVFIRKGNKIRFVTYVDTIKKEYEHKDGEKAYFFDDIERAEDVCSALNLHGLGVFVMEVPDVFKYEDFSN